MRARWRRRAQGHALGGNLAMDGAVRLAKELHALIGSHSNKKPSDTEVLLSVFVAYMAFRSLVYACSGGVWLAVLQVVK